MKNIVLICLLIAFTGCTSNQIRNFCTSTGKKVSTCCTSLTIRQKQMLEQANTDLGQENNQAPEKNATISLLEWHETVHIW